MRNKWPVGCYWNCSGGGCDWNAGVPACNAVASAASALRLSNHNRFSCFALMQAGTPAFQSVGATPALQSSAFCLLPPAFCLLPRLRRRSLELRRAELCDPQACIEVVKKDHSVVRLCAPCERHVRTKALGMSGP